MKELKKALELEHKERLKSNISRLDKINSDLKTKEESLNWVVRWVLDKRTSYSGSYEDQRIKCIKSLERKSLKDLQIDLDKLDRVMSSDDFSDDLIITIEWTKSHMSGSNPRSFTNYGFSSGSIGGCGYDKLSTSTAESLNSHLPLLKLMYQKKNDYLASNIPTDKKPLDNNAIHMLIFGYGSGYGILPSFECGVGVDCHQSICERLGLCMRSVSDTKSTNVYIISLKA